MRIAKGIAGLGILAYTGFTLFSCWIVYRERGNDWRRFWLGRHA
jgi:hypothetical protein